LNFRRLAREFGAVALLGAGMGIGGMLAYENVAAAPPGPHIISDRPATVVTHWDREFDDFDPPRRRASNPSAFRNCDAARAAGAAPVYEGQPGYGPHLDGDDDGIGCEPPPAPLTLAISPQPKDSAALS